MLSWIADNIWTVLICVVLIAIVTAIVVKLVKDKKKGKSACGCNCAHCALAGTCHNHSKTSEKDKK